MKRLTLTLSLLALPVLLHAQAPVVQPPITTVRVVVSGGVSPITTDLPVAGITGPVACVPAPTGTLPNATAFQYKVLTTDAQCWQYVDPGNGPLLGLPIGGTAYTATIAYVNSIGASPASNVSNSFSRPGVAPPLAPAVLRVIP